MKNRTEAADGEEPVTRGQVVFRSDVINAVESMHGDTPMILLAVGPLNPSLMNKLIEVVNQFNA